MLKANKSKWFESLFALYNRNLLKRRFNSMQVSNAEALHNDMPQIIYPNHSSWWDGLIAFEISRMVHADSFMLMEEKQLRKLSLFRRLGAFSIVRENPREAFESLNYAANLLNENPRRTLWIFPQGKILPNDSRPLNFYRGLARVIEKVGECRVVPCAIRYEFLGHFKPDIFIKLGEPEIYNRLEKIDSKSLTAHFETNLIKTLDRLKQDIVSNELSEYKTLFNLRKDSDLK
jgi:1-acyl-sn-glycerol-3-phosphate acyltransferase